MSHKRVALALISTKAHNTDGVIMGMLAAAGPHRRVYRDRFVVAEAERDTDQCVSLYPPTCQQTLSAFADVQQAD